eukprot:jgi/Chlat1/4949/Chrsp32S04942
MMRRSAAGLLRRLGQQLSPATSLLRAEAAAGAPAFRHADGGDIASLSVHAQAAARHYATATAVPAAVREALLEEAAANSEPQEFPRSVESLGRDWLGNVLKAAGHLHPNTDIKLIKPVPIGGGIGLVSQLYRLHIKYFEKAPGAPVSVIAKFSSSEPDVLDFATKNHSYEREVNFHKLMATDEYPLRVPRVYFAGYHARARQCLVVMQDLGKAEALDQLLGPSIEDVNCIIDDAASLHAKFWNHPNLSQWEWLPKVDEQLFKEFDSKEFGKSWPLCLERFDDLIPGRVRKKLGNLPAHTGKLLDALGGANKTLLHGDLRLDNIYRVRKSGKPAKADDYIYIDFGDCAAGRGTMDIAYFLSQSVDSEMRRLHEGAWITRYHQALISASVDESYTFARCFEDYRKAVLYYFCLAVNTGGLSAAGMENRTHLLARAMIQRSVAAILDLDVLELLNKRT